ncbi:MAG: FKBP-type peptidyl-prolyl cis-trans isomerase [Pseudomonadota bacterium]
MTRFLTAISAAALLAACTASSDDVGAAGEADAPGVAEGFSTCPDNLVLDLADYGDEALPETEDFGAWHMENASRDGVVQSDSGLQYKVIQAGMENGLTPMPGEEIFAHYHGYYPIGEVFDSSYQRGAPLIGPSNGFIAGWNEALAEMKVCEARTLYIPADLAYGNSGAGGRPTGTLAFHMQLLRVNRPDVADAVGVDRD